MIERYIGIENEFLTFENGLEIPFPGELFHRLRSQVDDRDVDFCISDTAIRTPEGHSFYIDVDEIELATPPVVINKGFATRLTDILMIGRDKLVNAVSETSGVTPRCFSKNYELTGYSMHWNVSAKRNAGAPELSHSAFFSILGVPFSLLTLTPLSSGIGLREKSGWKDCRNEILTDSINNEAQIKAAALFLGAYTHAIDSHFIKHQDDSQCGSYDKVFRNPVIRGRDAWVKLGKSLKISIDYAVEDPDAANWNEVDEHVLPQLESVSGKISAQKMLEATYSWMEPFVAALATKGEKQLLEDFITKRRNLEVDRKAYYKKLRHNKGYAFGRYYPEPLGKTGRKHIIQPSEIERRLPLESRLLGAIVSKLGNQIYSMCWDELVLDERDSRNVQLQNTGLLDDIRYTKVVRSYLERIVIEGIDNIYRFGLNLADDSEIFKKTPDLSRLQLRKTARFGNTGKAKHNSKTDVTSKVD